MAFRTDVAGASKIPYQVAMEHDDHAGTKQNTLSGSAAVAEMRSRLLPDQERKVLSLIRSANDSAK